MTNIEQKIREIEQKLMLLSSEELAEVDRLIDELLRKRNTAK